MQNSIQKAIQQNQELLAMPDPHSIQADENGVKEPE